jgi:hypothetical protein
MKTITKLLIKLNPFIFKTKPGKNKSDSNSPVPGEAYDIFPHRELPY